MRAFAAGEALPSVQVRDLAVSGIYAYSGSGISAIDDKGRLSVPAFLRKDLISSSDGRTLCLGKHEKWDCLVGFGLSRKIEMLAEIDKEEANAIARSEPYDRDAAGARKFSSLQELSFDASGRFVLPPMLQAIGGLKDNVIFHGIGKVFCLWEPKALLETTSDVPVDRRVVEFHLSELGKKK